MKENGKWKGNIDPLLNKRGELITNNAEKAEILNTFFASVSVGPQTLGPKIQDDTNKHRLTIVKEEFICELLWKLVPYKLKGLDNTAQQFYT